MKKNIKKYKGFSFIEMMVTVFVFSIVVTTSLAVFVNVSTTQKRSEEVQKHMEDLRLTLELMAKNIRMSSVDVSGTGVQEVQDLYFYNYSQGKCINYCITNTNIYSREIEVTRSDYLDCHDAFLGNCETNGFSMINLDSEIAGNFRVIPTDETPTGNAGLATVSIEFNDSEDKMQTTVSLRDYQFTE